MLNFRKVVERGNGTANLNEDQANYEKKVGKLEKACENFGNYLKTVKSGTPFPKIIEAFEDKNKGFRKQMEKNKLFSRTSKVLQEMRKNLSKFKKESFDPSKIDDYVRAFWFKAKKSNSKGYIKRSAIDDAQIVKFFTGKGPNTIPGILNAKKTSTGISAKARPARIKIDASTVKFFDEAQASMNTTKQCMERSENAKGELDEKLEIIKKLENITAEEVNLYTGTSNATKKELQTKIDEVKKTMDALKNELDNANNIWNNPNSTEQDKKQALAKTKDAKDANDKAVKALEDQNTKAEKVITDNLVNFINNYGNAGLFDEKTGTFTVKNESDFQKAKNHKKDTLKIVIENGIKKIKTNAFSDFKSLKEVVFSGDSCTNIGRSAFSDCVKLDTIKLEKIQKIGRSAFMGCEALGTINLNGATEINDDAFLKCKKLKNVVLGNNCTVIRNGAFMGCEELKNINLGKVQILEDKVFCGCLKLKKLDLRSVKEIHEDTCDWGYLRNDNGEFLPRLNLPKDANAKEIVEKNVYGVKDENGDPVFYHDQGMNGVSYETGTIYINNSERFTREYISEEIEKLKEAKNEDLKYLRVNHAQRIMSNAFKDYKGIIKATLDKDCKIVGDMTFSGCENLESINLESVQRIGAESFKNTALKNVNLESIQKMSSGAFSSCRNLETVTLGAGFTKINKETFSECPWLANINLDNVKNIGKKAFYRCTSLKKVNLKSVETLGQDTFKGCTGLKEVTLPLNKEKAAEIKELIVKQVGVTVGKNINFINDPSKKEQKK